MGIGTLLIGIALLVIAVTLVASPLLDRRRPANPPPSTREALETEHEAVLRAIREIDLDFRTHKLTEEDYKALRSRQVTRGAEVLRELDALKGDAEIDAEIEAEVAALSNAKAEQVAIFCPHCGIPVNDTDRFCARCGAALEPRRTGAPS